MSEAFEKEVKYLSRVTTDKRIATKHKPLHCWSERLSLRSIKLAQDKFPGYTSLVSISFVKRTSSFLRITDFLLFANSAKFKSKSLCKISKWELSRWPKVTKHRYATTILYFSYKYKTLDSKIQHFRRWVEFVMVWEIQILNLEGRSRCISFVSTGYETMTVIGARTCAKPWKWPFNVSVRYYCEKLLAVWQRL